MAFWCRIKQSKLKCLSHQFSRSYFQIPYNSSLIYTTTETRTFVFGKNPVLITPKRPTFCINARFFAAPVQVKPKQEEKDKSGPRLNEKITAQFIRLVVPDGEHLVVSRREALERAKKLKLDLVEVQRTADPPVCKLMDYHKEKYIKQVKEKERSRTKSKEVTLKKGDCKEVRFTVKTEQKDLQIKADTVKRLMERGYRVKCMAMGTEDQDLGGLLSRLSALIEDISMVESGPRVEKKQAYILVRHIKFGPSKKGGVKKLSKVAGTTSTEVERVATASPTIEASIPNQAPEQFDDDLTSAGSGSDTSDEIIIDDADAESDKRLEISRTTWSVSDTTDDFDKVFDFGDVKGATSHPTFGESTSAPEAAFSPANTHFSEVLCPKPILDSARANTVPSSPPKLPLRTESRHAISEPRNRTQPTISMENDRRGVTDFMSLEPQVPGQGKVPRPELNQSPTGPSFGTFSVPKVSAGHHAVATQLQRNKEGNSLDSTDPVKPGSHLPGQGMQQRLDKNVSPSMKHLGTNDSILRNRPLNEAPKQEQPLPVPPNPAASSYGIFSTSTTNAPSKLGTPVEINTNRKCNPFDSERKPNLRGSANSSNPASNAEGSQRQGVQGGFGIFSKENHSTNPSRTSE